MPAAISPDRGEALPQARIAFEALDVGDVLEGEKEAELPVREHQAGRRVTPSSIRRDRRRCRELVVDAQAARFAQAAAGAPGTRPAGRGSRIRDRRPTAAAAPDAR